MQIQKPISRLILPDFVFIGESKEFIGKVTEDKDLIRFEKYTWL